MVVRVDRVPIAMDVICRIIHRQRLDGVHLIVGDVYCVEFTFGEGIGVIAVKVLPEEAI